MKPIDRYFLQASGTLAPGIALMAVVGIMESKTISLKDGGMIGALVIGSLVGGILTYNLLKSIA
jgi:membrane protein DedA with SNARE-associated domain